jgi:hypothetical protein
MITKGVSTLLMTRTRMTARTIALTAGPAGAPDGVGTSLGLFA